MRTHCNMVKKYVLQHTLVIKTNNGDKTHLSGEMLLLFCLDVGHLSHNVLLSVCVKRVQRHLQCQAVE